jgi:hypothetical protein
LSETGRFGDLCVAAKCDRVRQARIAPRRMSESPQQSDNGLYMTAGAEQRISMHTLAARPAQALALLESLQESERRGVEGDTPWLGWNKSPDSATSHQLIAAAMNATPNGASQSATDELSTSLLATAARVEGTIADFARSNRRRLSPLTAKARARKALASEIDWQLNPEDRPAVGPLLTGQFTAQTQRRGTATAVLVESGLLPTAERLAQLGLLGTHEILEGGRLSAASVQFVSDMSASVATSGHPLGMAARQTPPAYQPYVAAVRDGLLTFVLAHEYGHILRRDLDVHPLGGSPSAATIELERECAADSLALRLTFGATLNSSLPGAGLTSAMLFLAGQDLFDRINAAMDHEAAPAIDDAEEGAIYAQRAQRLISYVEDSQLMSVYGDAVRLSMQAFHAVLFAWDVVAPALWELAENFHEYTADSDSGSDYISELISGPNANLWSRTYPLVAQQPDLRPIFKRWLS